VPIKLTHRVVEAAKCPPGRKDVLLFDAVTPGFGLRVTAAGSRVFLAQYTTPVGKRRVPLGPFGKLTVEQARRAALVMLGEAASGADPFADRKARADEAKRAQVDAAYTFGTMVDRWAAAREGDRRPSYLREAVACLQRNVPDWLDRPASGITLSEAVRALDALNSPLRNRVFSRTGLA
jgi:hypothetical protein